MNPFFERDLQITRRQFFSKSATGLGGAALASILGGTGLDAATGDARTGSGPLEGLPHHIAKAKRVIYLMQGGGPSHVDLFDPKPNLAKRRGIQLPDSVRMGQRLTTMTSNQLELPVLPAIKGFKRYGKSGMELSELLPYTGEIADEMCLVNSMHTEAINHAPACTFFLTGSQIPGRPSMGAWASYGLGSENDNLPTFVVMTSRDRENSCGQLFFDYYWGSGFIPSKYQGVRFRGEGDTVLYLSNPKGIPSHLREGLLEDLETLNRKRYEDYGDPEIATRIAQYEMAYRMQTSVPELNDITTEPQHVLDMYGPDVHRPGSYARNCLMARRLAEKGVRFIQLMHAGWDQHGNLPTQLAIQCKDTDQPSAALVKDLRQRGLLDDTLVIWGGEFGRTVFGQGNIDNEVKHGRDHHGRAFSLWMAGGGVKPGARFGATDDFAWNIVQDPVHVHDFQATVMHLLGVDHERLTYRYQGRRFRLTDVHGKVVKGLLA
ncbi:MAG: sulfatase [Opitutales bacterium TMED158]|nr:MAG: sulfatase [Opitutales bacterium TMED158]